MSRAFVGIDAGSSATKCVVLNARGELCGSHVVRSGFNYSDAAETALRRALDSYGVTRSDIGHCVSTGYGREYVAIADRRVTEITCHARGAREWYPQVRNIIDIGGQDTKVIRINPRGQITDYQMNTKCAAGTGTFLESIATKLGHSLAELDTLAMNSTSKATINSYCTVFAGTEVLERIKAGDPPEEISMGLFRSIASRTFEMIASHDGPVAATGGVVAHCRAMVRALEETLQTEIFLPPSPQLAGAYGAALAALEMIKHDAPTTKDDSGACQRSMSGGDPHAQ